MLKFFVTSKFTKNNADRIFTQWILVYSTEESRSNSLIFHWLKRIYMDYEGILKIDNQHCSNMEIVS